MTNEDAIGLKLDMIAAILKLGLRDQISKTRVSIREDKTNAAILDAVDTDDWTASGALQKAIAKEEKVSERTVRDGLSDLEAIGALEKQGGGPATQYRSTGLV